ncbi:thrombospondin type 3 repeat-containing protein [Candidatus Paraluminiphilus aquimaris]|uniref:thrombospondin type 3 repeat-containing protein n=1 Tax=Candidatus Paraluminiphilus aquimaris TaxID=2518994 RepID=UPI00242D2407|nr:thrombospondin type 3 repeat-containing protein [Candidatus Paraluminiphilus aquimaris]
MTPSRTLIPMTPQLFRQGLVSIFVAALSLLSVISVAGVHASEPKSESVVSTQSTTPIAPEIMFFILKGNGDGGEDTVQITDTDADGVADADDLCANTPAGAAVNAQGCADSQIDDDGDSVTNDLDQCPSTPTDETADAVGCSPSQLDSDDDGVSDDLDQCPNSSSGVVVDDSGCEDTSGSLQDDYTQNVNPLIADFQRGCTSSGCHGRVGAPGGLSLYGASVTGSPQQNYDSMVSYIDRSSASRLLGKLSGTLGHGGGVRYGTQTSGYQVIKTWAEAVEVRP